MPGYDDIIGHERIIGHFRNAVRDHQVSHAYILNGEKGSGKKMLANAFAKAILCEKGGGDACGMCRSCHRFDGNNHPDVKRVTHDKAGIGVDDIRLQLNKDVVIKPYEGSYKVYIVDEAEKMTQEAQNALLKTIEEPPAYAVIILLTSSLEALLPTVRSRCVILNLHGVDTVKIQELLMVRYKMPDYQARICAQMAQGNTGKAVMMATSGRFSEMREWLMRLLRKIDEMEIWEISGAAHEAEDFKADINDLLDMMTVWYRDVLVLKAQGGENCLVYRDEYRALEKKASASTFEGLNNILQALAKARDRIKANVNFDTTMEMLFLTIREN